MAQNDFQGGSALTQTDARERVAILIDNSGSMSGIIPDRGGVMLKVHAAVEGARTILQASDPTRTLYALLSFETECTLYHDLTDDFLSLHAEAALIEPRGGTAMDLGILGALSITNLQRIIMLTDGQPDSEERALAAAQTAKDLSVKIDTIGIGDSDDELLKKISALTGGMFHRAETAEQLFAVFATLETESRLALEYGGTQSEVIKL